MNEKTKQGYQPETAPESPRPPSGTAPAAPPPGAQMVKRPDSAFAPVGEKGIILRTFEELRQFAKVAVDGGAAPKGMTHGGAAMAIQAGLERGLGPLGGLQFCTVINGNLSWNAQGALALIRNSPVCKPGTCLVWVEGEGDDRKGVAVAWRVHYPKPFRSEFTMADARRADLLKRSQRYPDSKTNWEKYPDRQLRARAIGFLARDGFSDVLGGFPIAEEAEEFEPRTASPAFRLPETAGAPAPPAGPDPVLEALAAKAPVVIDVDIAPTSERPLDVAVSANAAVMSHDAEAAELEAEAARVSRFITTGTPAGEDYLNPTGTEALPSSAADSPSSLRSKLGVPREAANGTQAVDEGPDPAAEASPEGNPVEVPPERPENANAEAAEIVAGEELTKGTPSAAGRGEYEGRELADELLPTAPTIREFLAEAQEAGADPSDQLTPAQSLATGLPVPVPELERVSVSEYEAELEKKRRAESLALDAEIEAEELEAEELEGVEGQTPDLPGIRKGKA